jgi:hypothetical protein
MLRRVNLRWDRAFHTPSVICPKLYYVILTFQSYSRKATQATRISKVFGFSMISIVNSSPKKKQCISSVITIWRLHSSFLVHTCLSCLAPSKTLRTRRQITSPGMALICHLFFIRSIEKEKLFSGKKI